MDYNEQIKQAVAEHNRQYPEDAKVRKQITVPSAIFDPSMARVPGDFFADEVLEASWRQVPDVINVLGADSSAHVLYPPHLTDAQGEVYKQFRRDGQTPEQAEEGAVLVV